VVGELPPDGVVLAGVVAPLDGVVAPLDGEVEPLADVPVPLVEELLELVVVVAVLAATAGGVLGTLNCGAPEVSAVPVPPPPQAASPTPATIASTIAPADLDLRAPGRLTASGPCRACLRLPSRNWAPLRMRGAPCACRTPGNR
jgi:hypothetical protein